MGSKSITAVLVRRRLDVGSMILLRFSPVAVVGVLHVERRILHHLMIHGGPAGLVQT
jgi:hypothetical protein